MRQIRLGAVAYLNARPLVFGLDRSPRFALRYDVPSECARRLHEGAIDLGLIPSIEYVNDAGYRIVPDVAVASRGPVASVALFATRPVRDLRSIAMDTSSRTSAALVRVLCARLFKIQPEIVAMAPDLHAMLRRYDAAVLIGDNALLLETGTLQLDPDTAVEPAATKEAAVETRVEKVDLGEAWTTLTGMPFVWAFWAGRPAALTAEEACALQEARDEGVRHPDAIARSYFPGSPERQALAARYLRDNIKYYLGAEERAALEQFYRYAAEGGVVSRTEILRFYEQV